MIETFNITSYELHGEWKLLYETTKTIPTRKVFRTLEKDASIVMRWKDREITCFFKRGTILTIKGDQVIYSSSDISKPKMFFNYWNVRA